MISISNIINKKLLNFPNIRQSTNYTCGVSVTQAILLYYGIDIREDILSKHLNPDKIKGTSINSIINYLNSKNLKTIHSNNMSIKDLINSIDNSYPIIICIQAYANEYKKTINKDGHYVVVIGYDNNNIYFEDPSTPDATIGYLSFKDLISRWHDIDPETNQLLNKFGIIVIGTPDFTPKFRKIS
jgi:uncharacterized protein